MDSIVPNQKRPHIPPGTSPGNSNAILDCSGHQLRHRHDGSTPIRNLWPPNFLLEPARKPRRPTRLHQRPRTHQTLHRTIPLPFLRQHLHSQRCVNLPEPHNRQLPLLRRARLLGTVRLPGDLPNRVCDSAVPHP